MSKNNKKFATLDSFRKKEDEEESGGESGKSDNDDRQGFYVGGSETSGQQVLGPRRNEDMVTGLFDAARRAGAEQLSPEEAAAAGSTSRGESRRLQGGYVLGGHGMPSQPVTLDDDSDIEEIPQQPVRMTMFVWQDGFSIDDGPLRDFKDPENQRFLQQITSGRVPQEIMRAHPGKKVDFHMERKGTPYVKPKLKPFSGEGQRLGAVVPNLVEGPSSSSASKPIDPSEAEKLLKEAQENVNLTEGAPTTRLQIRLPSGQRLIGIFNPEHTVDAVRSFIVSAVPDLAFQPFQLMTTFPNKLIEDENLSLQDAGLLNAVIVVKFIG